MIINKTFEGANLKNEFIQKVIVTGYQHTRRYHYKYLFDSGLVIRVDQKNKEKCVIAKIIKTGQ